MITDSRKKCSLNRLINSDFASMNSSWILEGAGHDDAGGGPRCVAQWRVSTGPRWFKLGSHDKHGTFFPDLYLKELHGNFRKFLHFEFVVFVSSLHAPHVVFRELSGHDPRCGCRL